MKSQNQKLKGKTKMKNKIYDLNRRSYIYALSIIKFLDCLPKDYISGTIGKQLLRSATSIGANIVEAKSSSSKKDFINFYIHSLKSANETKFWIGLLKDSGKVSNEQTGLILNEATELANILAASVLTMKGKR